MLPEEDGGEFRALEAALIEELSPIGALQAVFAQRIAVAAWRLMRADRIEAEMLGHQQRGDGDLGLAVIRDGYGAGALATLLRYRGGALAEFTRLLRALKALQAEARTQAGAGTEAAAPAPGQVRPAMVRPPRPERPAARAKQPNEPERCGNPGERGRPADCAHPVGAPVGGRPLPDGPALRAQPIEPEKAWNSERFGSERRQRSGHDPAIAPGPVTGSGSSWGRLRHRHAPRPRA